MTFQFTKKSRSRPASKKRGPVPCLMPRDVRILRYIWKWKIASTSSIHEAIGRPGSPYSTYKVLEKLERNGFIECRFNRTERFSVWQLTELGFGEIRLGLGELAEEGFMSENHPHDRLVQAFQLGEWSTHQNPKVLFFTEQELRRCETEVYPEWVPTSKEHRADGYTRIVGHKRPWTLAYEVELTAKSLQRYEASLRFYKQAARVDQVLWLVSSETIRELILRAKSCIKDDSANFHVFVDLEEFLKSGWDATITNERSENLSSLRKKYQGICGDIYGEILESFQGSSKVNVHLETPKVIGKTRR